MAEIVGTPYREQVRDPNAGGTARVQPIRQVDVAPGRINLGPAQESSASSVIGAFIGIAKEIIPDKVNEALAQQRAEGYIAAQQGKTAAEVEEEQPWYTHLFGRSAAADGALNYQAEAATQEYIAAAMQGMGKDREMTPAEYRRVLAERAGSVATGDATTDAIIQSKVIQAGAQLSATHMKEHIAFTQEKAASARQASFISAGTAAEQMRNSVDRDAYGNQVNAIAAQLASGPVDGETPESFARSVSLAVEAGLVADNPFMYEALQTSGKMAELPESSQLRITEAYRQFQEREASKANASTVARMAEVFSMIGKVDAGTLGQQMLDLNDWQVARGGKEIWDAEGMARVLASSQDAFVKLQAAQQTAAIGAAQDADSNTLAVASALNPFAYSAYLANTGKPMPNETKQAIMTQYRSDAGFRKYVDEQLGPDAELQVLSNLDYVDPGQSAAVTASFLPNIGKRWEDAGGGLAFATQLDAMERLSALNPGLAKKYFGDPLLQARWDNYLELRAANLPVDRAYNQTFAAPRSNPDIRLDYKTMAENVKAFEKKNGTKLSQLTRTVLTNPSNAAYAKYGEEGFSVVAAQAKANSSTLWDYMVPSPDERTLNSRLGNLDDSSLEELIKLDADLKMLDQNRAGNTAINRIERYVVNRISSEVLTVTPVIDDEIQDDLSITTTVTDLQNLRLKNLDNSISKHRTKIREQGLGPQGDEVRNFAP